MDSPQVTCQPIDIEPESETQASSAESVKIGPIRAVENACFHIENDEIESQESRLGLRTATRSKAAPGLNAFGTIIGKAKADGKFRCIRYGQLETEPVCMICIDVALDIGPDREIKTLFVELAFSSEMSRAGKEDKRRGDKRSEVNNGIVPPTIVDRGWGPELLHGFEKPIQRDIAMNLQSEVNFGVGRFSIPSWKNERRYTEEQRWELGGIRLPDDAGCDHGYRIVNWTLAGKKLTRRTMPRNFCLGIIVEHGSLPFDLEFRYVGSLRAGTRKLEFGWARGQHIFQFFPPTEGALENLRREDLESLLREANGSLERQ